ncbi:response regulator transcription factor [Zoogloea sp.]|uniref:response regulator transcription factor n=1 Tax=Zoogloea sp. TaxID=49181 RepID=UPI002FE1F0D0
MASDLRRLRLLLVEPSAMQAKIICKACDEIGVRQVEVVGTASEALGAMARRRPDVVLSALYLPDGAGTGLVAAMRADPALASLPFILVSSETRPQALDPIRQAGACSILPKPFAPRQLALAINATLDYLAHDYSFDNQFDLEVLRVLLVDDSANARRFMRRVLENLGIRHIIEAADGKEAAVLMEETMVDLVVTDYNMPEMDGRELVEYVRSRSWQRSVPILMVTSETDQGRLAAVEEAGVSGICDKPFEPAVVRRLLARMLSQGAAG